MTIFIAMLTLPWQLRGSTWSEICEIIKPPITSIIEFDSRLAKLTKGIIKQRRVTTMFKEYFNAEGTLLEKQIVKVTFPFIQKLILDAPKTFKGIGVGLLDEDKNLSLTRLQIATLLACALFNLIGRHTGDSDDYPDFSLCHIFTCENIFPMACVFNYFSRMSVMLSPAVLNYRVIYRRYSCETNDIAEHEGSITGLYYGTSYVDEAVQNTTIAPCGAYVGDLFCTNTNTSQEEIALLLRPECLLLPIITKTLDVNTVVCVIGAEKMSARKGNASSVKFMGDFVEENEVSELGTARAYKRAVIFMNAGDNTTGDAQFTSEFTADLHKAFVGFSAMPAPGAIIASGHWSNKQGGNNIYVKFIQLLLGASAAGKVLSYHIADKTLEKKMTAFTLWARDFTIAELYDKYITAIDNMTDTQRQRINSIDIFDLVMDTA